MRGLMAMVAAGLLFAQAGLAQTGLPMRGLGADPDAPIEMSSDSLEASQADGTVLLRGNVLVVQGELRLSSAELKIEYGAVEGGPSRIERMTATGGVTLASATEQAEAATAVYELSAGTIVMSGEVLLTQGPTIVSGERLVVQLATGTGVMEGRVRTVINPGGGTAAPGAGRN